MCTTVHCRPISLASMWYSQHTGTACTPHSRAQSTVTATVLDQCLQAKRIGHRAAEGPLVETDRGSLVASERHKRLVEHHGVVEVRATRCNRQRITHTLDYVCRVLRLTCGVLLAASHGYIFARTHTHTHARAHTGAYTHHIHTSSFFFSCSLSLCPSVSLWLCVREHVYPFAVIFA